MKRIHLVTAIVVALACMSVQGDGPGISDGKLRIYLPRTATVGGSRISLGEMSIIRGPDALATKATNIPMGRAPFPGAPIVPDRRAIMSRLAASGFSAPQVGFTGARNITVSVSTTPLASDGPSLFTVSI